MDAIQKLAEPITTATDTLSQSVLGAVLVLSLIGNVALTFALVRCYRASLAHSRGDWEA